MNILIIFKKDLFNDIFKKLNILMKSKTLFFQYNFNPYLYEIIKLQCLNKIVILLFQRTALCKAILTGDAEIVKLLLDHDNIDVNIFAI